MILDKYFFVENLRIKILGKYILSSFFCIKEFINATKNDGNQKDCVSILEDANLLKKWLQIEANNHGVYQHQQCIGNILDFVNLCQSFGDFKFSDFIYFFISSNCHLFLI